MVQDKRRKHVVSYERMSEDVFALFNEKYPGGANDCFQDIVKYPKPDGTSFFAVKLETPEDIYLVKLNVKVDEAEDIEKWLEGEAEAEVEQMSGTVPDGSSSDDILPDENISQYGSDEDSSENI